MNPESKFFVHPSAVVDAPSEIGDGTRIWHFSHIMAGARIGRNCVIGQNVVVSPGCVVGDKVKIQNNVSVYTGVTIEDEVFLGPSMVFTNVINPRAFIERKQEFKKTLVRRGASIGANATILCGVTIGEYSMIGCGAVVTRDVPRHATVYGNPARIHGYTCWCGVQLTSSLQTAHEAYQCGECGRKYALTADGLALSP